MGLASFLIESLFQRECTINYLTFIAAAVCTLSLIEAIYVLAVDLRGPANRLYFFLLRWYGNTNSRRERKQARLILIFILPLFSIIWISGIGYAVLSEKTAKVTRLVVEGPKTDQIAAEMGVSVRTAKYYLASIYAKTNVKNRIELFNVLKSYHVFPEQEAESVAFPLLLKKAKKGDPLAP